MAEESKSSGSRRRASIQDLPEDEKPSATPGLVFQYTGFIFFQLNCDVMDLQATKLQSKEIWMSC